MSLTSRIRFDNKALRRLPIDPEHQNFTRQVASACFSRVVPTPIKEPTIVAVSPVALELLGLPRRVTSLVAPISTIDSEQHSPEDQAEAAILSKDIPKYLSGNEVLPGSETASHCYCGHQFGSFAGQLGDGAAIYLGEVVVAAKDKEGVSSSSPSSGGVAVAATRKATTLPNAASNTRWELQLKGAGPTPYSRSADGRKVLRSSLREFACSEIMFALGIPTTRAATLITSESTVRRDPLYTGREIDEKCTVVSRIAESFIRFGSFEICKDADDETSREGPSAGDPTPLQRLFEYVADELFTSIANDAKQIASTNAAAKGPKGKERKLTPEDASETVNKDTTASGAFAETSWQSHAAVNIFSDIVRRTAQLVAQWQAVGWCHGVLNTDNMSIIGLTIDYGPYAFMTNYDEDFVCNLSDHSGRYSFKNQPGMCKWNLGKLAEAWEIIFPQHKATFDEIVENIYDATFLKSYDTYMAAKLGFPLSNHPTDQQDEVNSSSATTKEEKKKVATIEDICGAARESIVDAFKETGADWTMTWRLLSKTPLENATEEDLVAVASTIANKHCCTPADRQTVLKRRMSHLRPQMSKEQILQLTQIADTNPSALKQLFTGSVEPEALKLFLADQLQMWEDLSRVRDQVLVLKKYSENPSLKQEEDQNTWFAALARYKECLGAAGVTDSVRMPKQLSSNPAFVLYPWILQDAIVKAETGSYSVVRNMVDRSMAPFDDDPRDEVMWSMAPPHNAASLCVSCSS